MTRPARPPRPNGAAARTHLCPGCGKPGLAVQLLACAGCWRALPAGQRAAVRSTYDDGDLAGHAAAVDQALAWYRANRQTGGVR